MLRQLILPDGLTVFSLNADETRFVHREVFIDRCYLRHGIELRDGDCVFDVGANIGLATLFFHRERRNVRIYAFEPSPATCQCLRANVRLHGVDARVFECGLSSRAGSAEFTFYPANSVMSGFHADVEVDRATTRTYMVNSGFAPRAAELFLGFKFKKTTFSCQLRRLSEVIDAERITKIDLLKVDVEKSERERLGGNPSRALAAHRPGRRRGRRRGGRSGRDTGPIDQPGLSSDRPAGSAAEGHDNIQSFRFATSMRIRSGLPRAT